jgi:putative addiction module component (TIGR02574 family)
LASLARRGGGRQGFAGSAARGLNRASHAAYADVMTTEDIISLSAAERLALIERLWDSLAEGDVPLTIARRAELEDRIATFEQERLRGMTWDALKAELGARAT